VRPRRCSGVYAYGSLERAATDSQELATLQRDVVASRGQVHQTQIKARLIAAPTADLRERVSRFTY
jgi:hypothetical protein